MTTMTHTSELIVMTCWCGTPHAVPRALYDHQRRCHDDGRHVPDIYCPLGHAHVPSGEAKVKQLERILANTDEDLRSERAAHKATKSALTKARKRADRGVCQHCNRSFVNVARHVATKHPGELDANAGR